MIASAAAKNSEHERRFRVTDSHVACHLDNELAILHLGSGIYYGLNSTGRVIWELLSEARCVSWLHNELVRMYAVEPAACLNDLWNLLNALTAQDLVHEVEQPHP